MKGPIYRWHCTMCGISDDAESPEMARLNIDVHLETAHPSARRPVRVQPDPSQDRLVIGTGEDDEAGPGPADGPDATRTSPGGPGPD